MEDKIQKMLDEHCCWTPKRIEGLKKELLNLFNVSGSFISVGEKYPPSNIELLVQSPEGQNYLASWRKAHNIFTCQSKGEYSFDWKWKEI